MPAEKPCLRIKGWGQGAAFCLTRKGLTISHYIASAGLLTCNLALASQVLGLQACSAMLPSTSKLCSAPSFLSVCPLFSSGLRCCLAGQLPENGQTFCMRPGQAGRGFLNRKVDSWVVLWLHTCNSTQLRKTEDSVAGWW